MSYREIMAVSGMVIGAALVISAGHIAYAVIALTAGVVLFFWGRYENAKRS